MSENTKYITLTAANFETEVLITIANNCQASNPHLTYSISG